MVLARSRVPRDARGRKLGRIWKHSFLGMTRAAAPPEVPFPLCRRWMRDFFQGLARLHSLSLAHRDLKPGNLMLKTDDAGVMVLKIGDFGASRDLSEGLPPAGSGRTGGMSGGQLPRGPGAFTPNRCTPVYSAPEMWTASYGVEVDLWSAGCIVGEMLNGDMVIISSDTSMPAVVPKIVERMGTPEPDYLQELRKSSMGRQVADAATSAKLLSKGPSLFTDRVFRQDIPEDGKDLTWALLRWNPSARLPAAECLKHAFLAAGPSSVAGPAAGASSLAAPPAAAPTPAAPTPGPRPAAPPQASPEPPPPPPPSTGPRVRARTRRRPGEQITCECTGHCCNPGHKYYRGCSAIVVCGVKGPSYCEFCSCTVAGCNRSRADSPLCHKHKGQLLEFPEELQLLFRFRSLAAALIPCDFAVLMHIWPAVSADTVLQTLAFWAKEPTAVLYLAELGRKLPAAYDAQLLLDTVLRPLAQYMNGRVTQAEHENLNTQGAPGKPSQKRSRRRTSGARACWPCGSRAGGCLRLGAVGIRALRPLVPGPLGP